MATVVKALVQLVMLLRHQCYCSFRRHEHKQLWFRLGVRQISGQGIQQIHIHAGDDLSHKLGWGRRESQADGTAATSK